MEMRMAQRQYKVGINRRQDYLLPPSVEEFISENNPVRVVDAYVDSLDLKELGFQNTEDEVTPGQPAYLPQAMLKLYLYGYLNRVRSSRRLATECERNLEVIWLIGGLRPQYKTIADFRKNNLKALRAVNQDFVMLCKELELYGGETVSIDGSFFRGNVGKKSIFTEERLKKSLEHLAEYIDEYLKELDQADETENGTGEMTKAELQEKLVQLRERQQKNQLRLEKLEESGNKQLAEVDADARLLSKRGQSVAGYNVQTAVDAKNKLLVVCEPTQDGNDEHQLEPIAKAAKAVLEVENLEATADRGFYEGNAIKNCVEAGITPYVPEPNKSQRTKEGGHFERDSFRYDQEHNVYRCPENQALLSASTQEKNGKTRLIYRSSEKVCAQCPVKDRCLPPKTAYRSVTRWEHEAVLEDHRARMATKGRAMMALRASLSEHPFGTIKVGLGWTHFLVRGLEKVRAEASLFMFSYNFKRVLSILGVDNFRQYCLQRA
jgi:transposase